MLKYYCKSFNYGKSGGNPAGVVILGDNEALEEKDMQKMAADIGFSETAFIKHKSGNVYEVRFFTQQRLIFAVMLPLHLFIAWPKKIIMKKADYQNRFGK